ncbi:nucleotidyltransferase [Candidatus Falkowbacteria bacterium]|nr:nucleotidyltransferase [Candidatus Falkowbacteria bacterium]
MYKNQKPTLLVLAAGMGSRYGGLKQIDKIGPSGEAILDYSVFDAIRAGFGKVVFVIRRELEEDFRSFFDQKLKGKIQVEYAFQELDNVPDGINVSADRKKPWGTGHAILVASDFIQEPFAAINADDFYGAGAYQAVAEYFKNNHNPSHHCMVGYRLDTTLSEHGTVSRGVCTTDREGFLESIREVTNIGQRNGRPGYDDAAQQWQPLTGDEIVSMNIWGFYPEMFQIFREGFGNFIPRAKDDPKAEYFIALPLMDAIRQGKGKIKVLKTNDQWFGVTYKDDKAAAIDSINRFINAGKYPDNLWK